MGEPQIWICSVCHRTLDLYDDSEGMRLQHTLQDRFADHEPAPIPADSTWRGRCDFCSMDEVTYRLPAKDFEVPYLSHHNSAGDWAACTVCGQLIEADAWKLLLERVVYMAEREWLMPMPPDAVNNMKILYLSLRTAMTGPIERIRKDDSGS